jgi:type IV secretory pathway component VirB8
VVKIKKRIVIMSDLPASLANSILRTAAVWRWMAIGLLILCIVLGIAIAAMMPLKSIQVEYVEFSSSGNNFVTVRSAGQDMDLRDVVNDISLRAYVVMREGVDQVTEKERYECVLY